MGRQGYSKLTLDRARVLRRAETRLWVMLRSKRFAVKFRRQQPIGPYIADFNCASAGLIVEVDGATHDGRGAYDARRTAWLEAQGYRVLRLINEDVYDRPQEVYRALATALDPFPWRARARRSLPLEGGREVSDHFSRNALSLSFDTGVRI